MEKSLPSGCRIGSMAEALLNGPVRGAAILAKPSGGIYMLRARLRARNAFAGWGLGDGSETSEGEA